MRKIDEPRLETDPEYRYAYVAEFIGFGPEDVAAIQAAAPALGPIAPALVDAVYEKLQTYDATWRHFVPRQHGYEGATPVRLEDLGMDHEQIKFRKQHLVRYLVALVTRPYDGAMVKYLDMVGKIHTAKAGSAAIQVPLVQMNSLMGFVADAFNATVLGLGLPREREVATLRAFSKLLWIQNDFIARHYAGSGAGAVDPLSITRA